jgi:hypothetical protein
MNNPMNIVWLSLLLTYSGCLYPTQGEPDVFTLGEPFELRYREVKLDESGDLRIKFADVENDSRCPLEVRCLVPGFATIKVLFGIQEASPDTLRVTLGDYVYKESSFGHNSVYSNGNNITLLALEPYPKKRADRNYKTYIATLRVDQDVNLLTE